MIRVFLVDDHEIVRRGVAELLGHEDDMEVVGEASTLRHALARIGATSPDVAVLDARLPDGSGIDLCRRILAEPGSRTRCLIFTAYDDDDATMAAVLAGASGYVLKNVRAQALAEAVRAVASGRSLLPPSSGVHVANRVHRSDDPRLRALGIRERQILDLITEGLTNRQIADRLMLAEKTVRNYVSSLLAKLGLERRTQAAVFQLEHQHSDERASTQPYGRLQPGGGTVSRGGTGLHER
jgi:two-component system, NarL family, response regulator DevR